MKFIELIIFISEIIVGSVLIIVSIFIADANVKTILCAIGAGVLANAFTSGLIDFIKEIKSRKINNRLLVESSKILCGNLQKLSRIFLAVNDPFNVNESDFNKFEGIKVERFINFFVDKYGIRFRFNNSLVEEYFDTEKDLIQQLDILLLSNIRDSESNLFNYLNILKYKLAHNELNIFIVNFLDKYDNKYFEVLLRSIKESNSIPTGVFAPAHNFYNEVNEIIALINSIKSNYPTIFNV